MIKAKVFIDPGHGGADPGATYGTYMEKNWTLDISIHMAGWLRQKGYEVALTRVNDATLNPSNRASLVRQSGANLCVSNHINAGGGQGSEVIYSIHRDDVLASMILEELVRAGMRGRRVFSRESTAYPGKDYYFIIRDTAPVETVIVEYGFIDNPDDLSRLKMPYFRQNLAEAAALGVHGYIQKLNAPEKPDEHEVTVRIIDFNGNIKTLPPDKQKLIDGRWYLEGRTLTELVGGRVSWDDKAKIATFDFSR
ncbi:MAG: N-acetylmuramoyl-L-alanine amidase [Bacillota bacterium]